MSLRVHNADRFEELRQTALQETVSPHSRHSPLNSSGRQSFGSPTTSGSPSSSKSYASDLLRETQHKRVLMKHDLHIREQTALRKKLAETIADNLQKQRTRRDAHFMKLWKEVDDGKALAAELRVKLDMQAESKQRQVQRMHDGWSADVYHKLNGPIVNKVATLDPKHLNARKHEAYQKFIDITNKKGGLFRDIIIESEYNPLSDLKCITYRTPVDDPVKRVIRRREEEEAIAHEGSNSERHRPGTSPLCRADNLDTKLWSQGVFESTPYGYFHKLINTHTPFDGSSKTHSSGVQLDHYDVEHGVEALRRELPRGKRTSFGDNVKIPRATLELK